ncbi:MAG: hypothetical protein FWF53_11385 [Candidatus Azobacteroides sp.]|nr:hypothetical protein [Candidatus Azobacteroides sp.]
MKRIQRSDDYAVTDPTGTIETVYYQTKPVQDRIAIITTELIAYSRSSFIQK